MFTKGRRKKITPEIAAFIDSKIRGDEELNYTQLITQIARKFRVKVSKSALSKRAKALKIEFRRGRKRTAPTGKRPAHSIFLDCAGAFFLKGAELELGVLQAINQMLKISTESARANRVLRLAQRINALLLYAPIFGIKSVTELAEFNQPGLAYLTEQKEMPSAQLINQYLNYLMGQKVLLLIIKEVTKLCTEALMLRIDFTEQHQGAEQTFFLDAQGRTVWPNSNIPRSLTTTLNKTKGFVKNIFQVPSAQRPLILQATPGYTEIPQEMFNLIQCFEQAPEQRISRILINTRAGENLAFWRNLQPKGKRFFIAPLSPWQYSRLVGTKIVRPFKQYIIGPHKESMEVADAMVRLFNPQLHKNIRVRVALIRRKNERLAIITNILPGQQRYIRKIAEQYFWRWPQQRLQTFYDILEQAHEQGIARAHSSADLAPLLRISYEQKPLDMFRLFLEQLHRYCLRYFFPAGYLGENWQSVCEKFYQQKGYLKIRQHYWEVILCPFQQKKLQKNARSACEKFNQSGIEFSNRKRLRICLM